MPEPGACGGPWEAYQPMAPSSASSKPEASRMTMRSSPSMCGGSAHAPQLQRLPIDLPVEERAQMLQALVARQQIVGAVGDGVEVAVLADQAQFGVVALPGQVEETLLADAARRGFGLLGVDGGDKEQQEGRLTRCASPSPCSDLRHWSAAPRGIADNFTLRRRQRLSPRTPACDNLAAMPNLNAALARLRDDSTSEFEKGRRFERLVRRALEQHHFFRLRFSKVWLWDDWPQRPGSDLGIDLVAEEPDGGLCAIQCKFYAPDATVPKSAIDSFLTGIHAGTLHLAHPGQHRRRP